MSSRLKVAFNIPRSIGLSARVRCRSGKWSPAHPGQGLKLLLKNARRHLRSLVVDILPRIDGKKTSTGGCESRDVFCCLEMIRIRPETVNHPSWKAPHMASSNTSWGERPVRSFSRTDCWAKMGARFVLRTDRTWPGVANPRRSPNPAISSARAFGHSSEARPCAARRRCGGRLNGPHAGPKSFQKDLVLGPLQFVDKPGNRRNDPKPLTPSFVHRKISERLTGVMERGGPSRGRRCQHIRQSPSFVVRQQRCRWHGVKTLLQKILHACLRNDACPSRFQQMNFVGNFYAIRSTLSTSPFQEVLADRVECIDQADVRAERLNGMRHIGGTVNRSPADKRVFSWP